jgi:hypothetical protein
VKKRGVGDFDSWRTSDGGIAKSLCKGGIQDQLDKHSRKLLTQ